MSICAAIKAHLQIQLAGCSIFSCQHRLQRCHTRVDDDQISMNVELGEAAVDQAPHLVNTSTQDPEDHPARGLPTFSMFAKLKAAHRRRDS